jgi:plasmid stabilization system protein ParE
VQDEEGRGRQPDRLENRFGERTASKTLSRIELFLSNVVASHPKTGTPLGNGLSETAIPRTPFVAIYRIEPKSTVLILGFFHSAPDRSAAQRGTD